jgi:hypothetical protein
MVKGANQFPWSFMRTLVLAMRALRSCLNLLLVFSSPNTSFLRIGISTEVLGRQAFSPLLTKKLHLF